ncbi:CPBP family intramembrane metalloprotease [Arthrobacter sp. zg-Y1219]|uniref:CPBP family intramembrane glutamic endopeptidase n=1 Tax=Arthrobacter sp. zg-Y1219 TaxID=3049067 RepID=UPI0024C466A8|nr:CPBP family intramembrane metalloprotease [Arthrobacter sp. zg-Y1219]MDK1361131.1 CPBP family intramembrane metalloprotease [Arthrobacter sp. zg-Y1219]
MEPPEVLEDAGADAAGPDFDAVRAGRRAGALLLLRLGLVAVATVTVWLLVRAVEGTASFPPTPMLASLSLLPVNIVSLLLVSRLLQSEGRTLRSLFAPRRSVPRDAAWGLLWIAVLFVPFVLAVMGTMWLLHGPGMFEAFETVFYDPDAATIASPLWGLALGALAVATFAPLNAPAEEAVYRGYAQSRLSAAWSPWPAMLVCALAFGAQHAFFAPTTDAMIVYVSAFTVWGLGSALIVRAQRRLLPVTIAHLLVNLMTSSPALVFPILQLTGVVPS